ncbi:hypothetical protein Pelo_10951 [Pelomyxa schiedti]|nr:hypothetical protein Pelo_10951 [Pelomyxa schiedti]
MGTQQWCLGRRAPKRIEEEPVHVYRMRTRSNKESEGTGYNVRKRHSEYVGVQVVWEDLRQSNKYLSDNERKFAGDSARGRAYSCTLEFADDIRLEGVTAKIFRIIYATRACNISSNQQCQRICDKSCNLEYGQRMYTGILDNSSVPEVSNTSGAIPLQFLLRNKCRTVINGHTNGVYDNDISSERGIMSLSLKVKASITTAMFADKLIQSIVRAVVVTDLF